MKANLSVISKVMQGVGWGRKRLKLARLRQSYFGVQVQVYTVGQK
jgi:hypothetical protein